MRENSSTGWARKKHKKLFSSNQPRKVTDINLQTHNLQSDVPLILKITYCNERPGAVTQNYKHFCPRIAVPAILLGVQIGPFVVSTI